MNDKRIEFDFGSVLTEDEQRSNVRRVCGRFEIVSLQCGRNNLTVVVVVVVVEVTWHAMRFQTKVNVFVQIILLENCRRNPLKLLATTRVLFQGQEASK